MSKEFIKKHLNIPQLLVAIIKAMVTYCIWGRATGKSEGPMAMFSVDNIHKMPRSNGFLMGTTYEQLLTRTLPPLIAGWEKMGYYQDVHFWVKKWPNPKLKVPKAYRHPQTADHYIQWYNGSGIYLVSQDRPGTMNGIRTQWGAADEARFLDKKRMDEEVIPTMAGHADKFGHLSNYLSILYCSDMPRNSKGKWLLEASKEMDEEIIQGILQLQAVVIKTQQELPGMTLKKRAKELKKIQEIEFALNELRKNTVYVSYASTFDNIHALGTQVLKQLKRNLSDLEFNISIANQRIKHIENGFYYLLDEDIHGYESIDYSALDSTPYNHKLLPERTCLWDNDVNLEMPLDIAADFNNKINCMIIGQRNKIKRRFLKSMYVLNPELLKDLVKKFCKYYAPHRTKKVNFIYDNTAIGKNASTDVSFADEWVKELENNGWEVTKIYIGQASTHISRYYAWSKVLEGNDVEQTPFEFNRTNCMSWKVSCEGAGVIKAGEFIKKDKSNEKDPNTPPEEATHLSEAGDTLFMYWYLSDKSDGQQVGANMTM